MKVRMFTWDWKDETPLEDIGDAVATVSGNRAYVYRVETGSDNCAAIVCDRELTPEQVTQIYHQDGV